MGVRDISTTSFLPREAPLQSFKVCEIVDSVVSSDFAGFDELRRIIGSCGLHHQESCGGGTWPSEDDHSRTSYQGAEQRGECNFRGNVF